MTMLSPFRPAAPPRSGFTRRRDQAGVALAVALVILVVITLIGVTAIRRAQLQARLSQNAEATVMARGTAGVNAQAMVNQQNAPLLSQIAGDSFSACWLGAGTSVPDAIFTCTDSTTSPTLAAFAAALPESERKYSYFQVRRDTPATLPTNTLRGASLSGIAYQFANFSVLSGFDASKDADGVAEVSQSVLLPAATVPGVYELKP